MLVLFGLGLVIGSFLGVLTWRIPRKLDFVKGRSKCPHCSHLIQWYDNIPLLSFLFLKGRCRNCHKKISLREPLIELATAISFALTPLLGIPFPIAISLTLVAILVAIFVIDLEHKLIYDEFVWLGLGLVILFYGGNLVVGFAAALFLLSIALVTKGRGMGLGDVKLALFLGTILTPNQAVMWLTSSFLTGALVGVILILSKKAGLKTEVPFGPFLLIGFLISLLLTKTNIYANFL